MVSTAMLQKPGTIEVAVNDLMHGAIEISMVPTSPIFYKFKNPGVQQYNTSNNQYVIENGEMFYNSSTGLVAGAASSGEFTDNMDMTGGVAFNVLAVGLPSAATTQPILQVEIICHLEGTPSISTASNVISLSGADVARGSTQAVDAVLAKARDGGYWRFLKSGSDFLNSVASNPIARNLAGYALRGLRGNRNSNHLAIEY